MTLCRPLSLHSPSPSTSLSTERPSLRRQAVLREVRRLLRAGEQERVLVADAVHLPRRAGDLGSGDHRRGGHRDPDGGSDDRPLHSHARTGLRDLRAGSASCSISPSSCPASPSRCAACTTPTYSGAFYLLVFIPWVGASSCWWSRSWRASRRAPGSTPTRRRTCPRRRRAARPPRLPYPVKGCDPVPRARIAA